MGSGTRILVVEDEVRLAELLQRGLTGEGYLVDVVHDGASALNYLEAGCYEILVLDRDLPILHGDIVARTLRDRGSPVRVLMLTAAAEITDEVTGLNLGADDYLAKPFDYEVLLARLTAIRRRLRSPSGGYEHAGIRLEPGSRRVWCDQLPLHLRPKEFSVLAELVKARGEAVRSVSLFDAVWGDQHGTDEAVVKTVIHSLRKKLGHERIATEHGVGYRVV
ncbi:response regulator transcription factor [Gulosibacter molinativorax]|nr:response regulator transcription factor [Gulosibacter molinativorax]QUY61673.1 Transcriptional regulatory protein CusR [Gulosibacter molinativorax]